MPQISEAALAALHKVAHDAAAVCASINRDENGDMIAGQFVGNGNGGNISRGTLQANGQLQLSLSALTAEVSA